MKWIIVWLSVLTVLVGIMFAYFANIIVSFLQFRP